MKRIGTSNNYIRISETNEHLLQDPRMVEVQCIETKKGLKEETLSARDLLASKDLARIIGEIVTLDQKRESLIKHAQSLVGGTEALISSGVELPEEQTIHDSPAARTQANQDKQAEKGRAVKAAQREAVANTKKGRQENDKKAIANGAPVTGVAALPAVEMPATNNQVALNNARTDEDI